MELIDPNIKFIQNIYSNKKIKIYLNGNLLLINYVPANKIMDLKNYVNGILYKFQNNDKDNFDDFTDEELCILSNQNLLNKESEIEEYMLNGLINKGNLYYYYVNESEKDIEIKFNI